MLQEGKEIREEIIFLVPPRVKSIKDGIYDDVAFPPIPSGVERHGSDLAVQGIMQSGGSLVGLNVVATAKGSAGSWASAFYAKMIQAAKAINGYLCAAELELASSGISVSDLAVLVLNSTCVHTGSPPACIPYIMLRDYGSSLANVFVRLMDAPVSDGGVALGNTIFSDVNAAKTHSHSLSIMVGTTRYWIMCHAVAPD